MKSVFLLLCIVLSASAFEIGQSYKYTYTTTLNLDERCEKGAPLGHRVTAQVHLTTVWASSGKKLIKIELLNPRLWVPIKSQFKERSLADSKQLQSQPSFVLLAGHSPEQFWDSPEDPLEMRNLKRGIASFLLKSDTDREVKEKDVSGVCDTIYKVKGNTILRRKGNCIHSKFDQTLSQTHGVRSATTDHLSEVKCEWSAATASLARCTADEHARLFSNAWHKPSLCVQTKSEFQLEGSDKMGEVYDNKDLESVIEKLKKTQDLEQSDLESILNDTQEKPAKRQLKASIAKFESDLKTEHLAKLRSATAFYRLLPVFRAATSGEILQVLNNGKLKDIIPQLLDLVSACATENCLKAAFEFFETEKEYNEILERFLISLSILPRPNALLLNKLKSFLELKEREERIEATLLTTIGTLLKAYSENLVTADTEIIEDIRKFLESRLKKCDKTEDEDCELNHLRSLRNAAQPRSVPLLLHYTTRGGRETMEALLALKNIPQRLLPPETFTHLLRVFNQVGTRQDRSARAVALEMLLKLSPKKEILRNLLFALKDQEDDESSTFLASKILHAISQDTNLKSSVTQLLSDKDINYYHALAQKGQSSLFRRPMISVQGTNVTFGLENEFLSGGMLKRAVFDVSFENRAQGDSTLLSVGIFAAGLGALAGGGDSSGAVDEASGPTAGLNLGFLNSALRPYIFFRSSSELMGHAWSGTASELTPVLQSILMFSDDERIVVLNNGMLARAQLRGALSVNGAASVQISLWRRNSQSLVKNEGALIVRGAVTVDAGFVVTQGTLQFTGASGVDFKIDLDFYEAPFTTCLQMEHPPVSIKSDVHRTVTIPGSKYQLKKSKKRTLFIPGRSFAFNERNNEMCAQLHTVDES